MSALFMFYGGDSGAPEDKFTMGKKGFLSSVANIIIALFLNCTRRELEGNWEESNSGHLGLCFLW